MPTTAEESSPLPLFLPSPSVSNLGENVLLDTKLDSQFDPDQKSKTLQQEKYLSTSRPEVIIKMSFLASDPFGYVQVSFS